LRRDLGADFAGKTQLIVRNFTKAGVCAVIFIATPPRRGSVITAHIIDIRPRKTKLLPKLGLSPAPCKQRRRSASRLRSRAVKLHGFWDECLLPT